MGCSIGKRRSSTRAFSLQKRGPAVGKTKRGKGTKRIVVVAGKGLPLGSYTDSASPAEVRLAEKTLQQIKVPKKVPGRPKTRPKRVIGDKAYDSDPLRKRLRKRGINLLSPHRRNHRNVNRQDDRLWDRYRRRYIVERTFRRFGRIVVRYEHESCMYDACIQIACIMIIIKRL
jgi:transposase